MAITINVPQGDSQSLATPKAGETFLVYFKSKCANNPAVSNSFGYMPDNNHPEATHRCSFINVYKNQVDLCNKAGIDLLAHCDEMLATGGSLEVVTINYGDDPSTIKVKPLIVTETK